MCSGGTLVIVLRLFLIRFVMNLLSNIYPYIRLNVVSSQRGSSELKAELVKIYITEWLTVFVPHSDFIVKCL